MRRPTLDCYAITPPGIEGVAARELAALGVRPGVTEPGGVAFRATTSQLYAANLHLRTANRVLVRIAEFPAVAFHELERRANRVPWEAYIAPGRPVRFRVTSRKSKLYHQEAVAERLQAAADRQARGIPVAGETQPAGDDEEPDGGGQQIFVVRLVHDRVAISADSSGELLHRRGYRQAGGKAPLRETIAAGMLLAAGYDGSVPLLDPMCGSGTIPIEAGLIARKIPPGRHRRFAFEHWPEFNAGLWASLKERGRNQVLPHPPSEILGSDRDQGVIAAARDNAGRAGVSEGVTFRECSLSEIEPPGGPGLVLTNPPYGERLGDRDQLRNLYSQFGNVLRRRCPGWTVAMLSARRELAAQVGLRFESSFRTSNGGIGVQLVRALVGD